MNSVSFRLRKRLTHGWGGGVNYTLSKSIDDASSIGGGGSVVAQNDLDLAAERGLSSFDQRHRVNGDFAIELPFGANKRWLNNGVGAAVLGSWVLNGNVTLASGTPFTVRLLVERQQRGERRQRHAARQLQRRAHRAQRSDDAGVLQHRRVFDAGARERSATPGATRSSGRARRT